jgi:hypothetical protein
MIIVCMLILNGAEYFTTGNLYKENPTTYILDTANGFYTFPKEACIIRKYQGKREKR